MIKLLIFFKIIFATVSAQQWGTRFDYEDYEPVPIIQVRPPGIESRYRQPIQMRGVPRYRPTQVLSHPDMNQMGGHSEEPGLEIAGASFRRGQSSQPAYGGGGGGGQGFFKAPEQDREQKQDQNNGVNDFMSRLATTIPEIAEKMARLAPPEAPAAKPQKFNTGFYTFQPPTAPSHNANDFLGNVKKSGLGMFFTTDPVETETDPNSSEKKIADLVHSMPVPESLFSFNKLLSAFSGITQPPPNPAPRNNVQGTKIAEIKENEIYDMRLVKGTRIEKDEDESSEVIQKPDEFVDGFSQTKTETTTEAPNPADNLLGTILSGNLDKVDWFGALFNKNTIPGAGEQNPITQFLKGGFFGSGLEDNTKVKKDEDQNFN